MTRRLLVVGGCGYIGSHMVKCLLEAGHEVVVLDDLSGGHRDALLGGELVVGRCGDAALLDALFSAQRFDGVLHFASFIQVGESVQQPIKYYLRHGLCSDLGFSARDREENIRRVGEVAKLMIEAGMIVQTAFISPFRKDRELVRSLVPHGDFLEIHCRCPLEVCEARDVKGLYRRARAGEIPDFTGISSPYEAPDAPELAVDTGHEPLAACVGQVMDLLRSRGIIDADRPGEIVVDEHVVHPSRPL